MISPSTNFAVLLATAKQMRWAPAITAIFTVIRPGYVPRPSTSRGAAPGPMPVVRNRLAVERLAGLAGLDAGEAAGAVAARGMIRTGIDGRACGWQVYCM
jgi:hypothetical protein